jgi:glycosyltransferase involved in cell wall biosynthesis
MHIAVLIPNFLPETGAGPARISEFASEWMEAGHTVSIITGFPSRRVPGQRDGEVRPPYRGRAFMRETLHGMLVYRSWALTGRHRGFVVTVADHLSFAASSFAHALARVPKPDVLVSSGPPYFSFFAGAALSITRRVPLVLDIRDLWPDYLVEMGMVRSPFLQKAMFASERWLLARASSIVVVTESFRQTIISKGIAPERISVITNGVDASRYYPADEPPPLAALARREGERCVGYLGTFGAGQGLVAVIDAARQLRAAGQRIRFVLVGDGADRSRIESLLHDAPVEGVTVHPPIARDQTRAFYNACDAVLVPHAALPALAGTIPSKIFEVMACGRPLVAALQGEGARIVATSGGGVLAKPGDAPSIAAAITHVLNLPESARKRMGELGRAFALARYDRRILGLRYLDLLEREARAT